MSGDLVELSPLARATELARAGNYGEAELLLAQLGGRDSTDPAVLDLLARIHAQRGELLDADQCWAAALRLDDGFTAARAGRQRIAALVSRRPRTGRTVLTAALAAVAVTGAAAGLLALPRPEADPAVLAELNALQHSQQEQADRLGQLGGKLDNTVHRQERTLDDLTAALAGTPAFSTRVDAGAVTVGFADGVFRTGIRPSDDGAAALAELARRLGPFAAGVSITVVGHTEDARVSPGSGYTGNAELGLARAMTAAERMSQATGLPLTAFALASSGAADPPFPNDSRENRARNRTVTVVVRPR